MPVYYRKEPYRKPELSEVTRPFSKERTPFKDGGVTETVKLILLMMSMQMA